MQAGAQVRFFFFFFSSSLVVLVFAPAAEARIRHHKWEVTYQFRSPDCYKKLTVVVNGQMPCPTIHGIRQIGTPWHDGTESITQCPVLPGETFVCKFVVDRVKNGVPGKAFICKLVIDRMGTPLIRDSKEGLTQRPILAKKKCFICKFVLDRAILIRGRCKLDCTSTRHSTDTCNMTTSTCSLHVMTVVNGKTYHPPISSIVESSEPLVLEIESHNMAVVEASGNYAEPPVATTLKIRTGETYSVLLKADLDAARNYWVSLVVASGNPSTNATRVAIFNYYPNDPGRLPTSIPQVDGHVSGSTQSISPSRNVIENFGFAFVNLFPVMCLTLYVFVKLRRG